MSEIWCKNIHAFLRYSNFCVGIFYFDSLCRSQNIKTAVIFKSPYINERSSDFNEIWYTTAYLKLDNSHDVTKYYSLTKSVNFAVSLLTW